MKNYNNFILENNNNIDVRDVAWLYFLHYIYDGAMSDKTWGNDKRMGVSFKESMEKFNCIKFENGEYYSNKECEKIIDDYFGSKTFENSIKMEKDLKKYDIRSYKISNIPYELYLNRNPKISDNFSRISDRIVDHFNSQVGNDKILNQLSKSRNIKEWNFKTSYQMFDGKIPEKIKIYRGIKHKYDPEFDDGVFSCWTTDKNQGERFAKYHFTGQFQTPRLSKEPTLFVAEVDYTDIVIFIGGDESEIIMRNPVNIKEIIDLNKSDNLNETKSNMTNIEYLAVVNNTKYEPILYVTDFKIIKDDGDKLECKIKGYRYMDIKTDDGVVKKGWIEVDDFENNRTHKLNKNNFKSGTSRRKIYDIKI